MIADQIYCLNHGSPIDHGDSMGQLNIKFMNVAGLVMNRSG